MNTHITLTGDSQRHAKAIANKLGLTVTQMIRMYLKERYETMFPDGKDGLPAQPPTP